GVQSGSPAEGAGLKEGDIIIQLAGIEVQNLEDLVSALRSKKPGERVEILVLRQGKPLTLQATLGSRG
ncbi:MAG: PDZ domain-containing protein, partial [Deltaproteobacteria bacterium]|nr:PDZ domain-containing protein [Deltaproteobacteria bacterium]